MKKQIKKVALQVAIFAAIASNFTLCNYLNEQR